MIVDSHAHAWPTWPYAGPSHDASVEALVRRMDAASVDHALVVGARLHPGDPDDNRYLVDSIAVFGDRLSVAVEVSGAWAADYDSPGAAQRLRAWVDAAPVAGVALYPRVGDSGWMRGVGRDLIAVADELGLVVSAAVGPELQGELRAIADEFSGVPILLHHLGLLRAGEAGLDEVVASASSLNIALKLSGLTYTLRGQVTSVGERAVTSGVVEPLLAAFGPRRLLWGSDSPSGLRHGDEYHDSLLRVSNAFSGADAAAIRGGTAAGLLGLR